MLLVIPKCLEVISSWQERRSGSTEDGKRHKRSNAWPQEINRRYKNPSLQWKCWIGLRVLQKRNLFPKSGHNRLTPRGTLLSYSNIGISLRTKFVNIKHRDLILPDSNAPIYLLNLFFSSTNIENDGHLDQNFNPKNKHFKFLNRPN